jgi:Ca-activated chloride channel family protein
MKNIVAMMLGLLLTSAHAAERLEPTAMLVLDGSGSMWGQIDGVAKISIAQDVLTDLLETLPADQALGLTAYGHRIKGNCADIEVMVAPGEATRASIEKAVRSVQPKGKTPLSDALLIAADALNFTEGPATVILVTDGLENCDRDPCATARSLAAAGADFTTHVIGFDITATEGAKLECIATETGGLFLPAKNANELAKALDTVALAAPALPEYQAQPLQGQFEAYDEGGLIFKSLRWTLYGSDGEVIVSDYLSNQLLTELQANKKYRVVARKLDTGEEAELEFEPKGEGLTFSRSLRFARDQQ